MFKLQCTYKNRPALVDGNYKLHLVSGRARVFSIIMGEPTPVSVSPGTDSAVWFYTVPPDSGETALFTAFAIPNSQASGSVWVDREGVNCALEIPSSGILFETGVYAWMNQRDTGITVIHSGGVSA